MKYYKIEVQSHYLKEGMIASHANGDNVENGEKYFDLIDEGELLDSPPVFNSFFLESFDKKKYWEWILCDVHGFIGEGSQMTGSAILVSPALKEILESVQLATPYRFYPSTLKYKREILERYIFHYSGDKIWKNKMDVIDFKKSHFYHSLTKETVEVDDVHTRLDEARKIYNAHNGNHRLLFDKIVLKEPLDFFCLSIDTGNFIASERFRERVESAGLVGFEFSELEYEVEVL